MTNSLETAELEKLLKRGEKSALAELFSRYRLRLQRIVGFRLAERLKSRVEPEDVLQEAFLAAAKRLDSFKENAFIWLRLIVQQTLVDVHRIHLQAGKRDARREISIEGCRYPQATSESLAIHLVGSLTSPTRAAVRAETLVRVEQAIATMDPIDQEILALRHFEELTNSETAQVLKIEQKAAGIRYVRALRRLKDIIAIASGEL